MKRFGLLLLAAVLSFTFISCENFLKGADIKQQLDDAIEIANSQPVTISVNVEKGSGSVNYTVLSAKKKYTFNLEFTPAASWQFIKWEVFDHITGQKIDDAIEFENPASPNTKITVLNAQENLEIRPVCLMVQVTPDEKARNWANIPIKIQFNVPVKEDVINNIDIKFGDDSVLSLFDSPILSSDKKLITIVPKANDLAKYISSKNLSVIEMRVLPGSSIKTNTAEIVLSEKLAEFRVWYETTIEDTPPVIHDFFVTRVPAAGNIPALDMTFSSVSAQDKFVSKTIDALEQNAAELLKNRTSGTVYIYGRCYDKDSGVQTVIIHEKRTNAQNGTEDNEPEEMIEYSAQDSNAEFLNDGNGNTVFRVKHTLKGTKEDPKNGAILLSLEVADGAGNSCDTAHLPKLSVIKNTTIDLSLLNMKNYIKKCFYTEGTTTNPSQINPSTTYDFDYEFYTQNSSKIYFNHYISDNSYGLKETVYKNIVLPADKITLKMQLSGGETQTLPYDQNLNTWNLDFAQAFAGQKLGGKTIKLIVTDDIGSSSEKEYKYPDALGIVRQDLSNKNKIRLIKSDAYDSSVHDLYIVYKLNGVYKAIMDRINEDDDGRFKNTSIPAQATECFAFQQGDWIYSGPSEVYYPGNAGNSTPASVQFAGESPYYTLDRSREPGFVDVTINIAENSWNNDQYDSIYIADENMTEPFITKGTNSIVLPVELSSLKNYTKTVKFYGIKNSCMSSESSITIAKLSAEQLRSYDNYVSRIDITSNNYVIFKNYETLKIQYGYGDDLDIEYFKFKLNNMDEVSFYPGDTGYTENSGFVKGTQNQIRYSNLGTNNAAVEIPVLFFNKGVNTLKYEKKDLAGNKVSETIVFDCPWVTGCEGMFPVTMTKQEGKWNLQSKPHTRHYDGYIDFYNLSDSQSDVPLSSSYYIDSYSVYAQQPGYSQTTRSNIQLPANSFIRVAGRSCYCTPYIFYTGSGGSTNGKSDLLISNGGSTDSVAVQSDAPVFVHTVVTDEPYNVCKNWSVTEWETYKKHVGDELFPSGNITGLFMQRYDIPGEQINPGQCYCVIAHYAAGTTIMSQVMVR